MQRWRFGCRFTKTIPSLFSDVLSTSCRNALVDTVLLRVAKRCSASPSPSPVTSDTLRDFRTASDDDDRAGLDATVQIIARKVDADEQRCATRLSQRSSFLILQGTQRRCSVGINRLTFSQTTCFTRTPPPSHNGLKKPYTDRNCTKHLAQEPLITATDPHR